MWLVDGHWVGRPIDVEAGDLILLHERPRIEGDCTEAVTEMQMVGCSAPRSQASPGWRIVPAGLPSSGCPGATSWGEMPIATGRRQTISGPLVVVERNMSIAWGKAFLKVFESNEIPPLVVVIDGLQNADPPEIPAIRSALDAALGSEDRQLSCLEVANTIFPASLWNPEHPRTDLYERYLTIIHRIRKRRGNRYGVYFQRLIAFGADSGTEENVNQLEHIISTWNGGNRRRSALQASLVDPRLDHTNQRQRGFPCLQQVAFAPVGENGLTVTGFYAKQHMYERAYGNYLGLCRLGRFMAHEMGLTLSQIVCIATPAARDRSKRDLAGLARRVESALLESDDEAGADSQERAHA